MGNFFKLKNLPSVKMVKKAQTASPVGRMYTKERKKAVKGTKAESLLG